MEAVCHHDRPPMPNVGFLQGSLFTEGQIHCAYLALKEAGCMHRVACNRLFLSGNGKRRQLSSIELMAI